MTINNKLEKAVTLAVVAAASAATLVGFDYMARQSTSQYVSNMIASQIGIDPRSKPRAESECNALDAIQLVNPFYHSAQTWVKKDLFPKFLRIPYE